MHARVGDQRLSTIAPFEPASARPNAAPARVSAKRWLQPVLLATNLAALAAIALWLRVWQLGNLPGMNGDETWYGVQALRILHGQPASWETPSGNFLNLLFVLPLIALHAIWAPSFALLRVVPLVSGLLALPANYWLCQKAFDRRTAVVSTMLLALLPINIAYCRFAWDASQTLLTTLFVLYLPLIEVRNRGRQATVTVGGMVALVAAIWVHPTNIFAAPLLVMPVAYLRRDELRKRVACVNQRVLAIAVGIALVVGTAAFVAWQVRVQMTGGLRGPADFVPFARNYLKLFSGATAYQYLSGLGRPGLLWPPLFWLPMAVNVVFAVAAIAGLWGMLRRLQANGTPLDGALVLGWATMLAGFFVVAGPAALTPHYERYAMALVAPGALVLARGWAWWLERSSVQSRRAAIALGLAAWLLPLGFYLGYFSFIEQTGGRGHNSFRTAAVEPKQVALDYVLAHRRKDAPVRIVCDEWWLTLPFEYLAFGQDGVEIFAHREWRETAAARSPSWARNTWFVDFPGTDSEAAARALETLGTPTRKVVIDDFSGGPCLVLQTSAENLSE